MISLKREEKNIAKIFENISTDRIESVASTTFLGREAILLKTENDYYIVNVTDLKKEDADFLEEQIAKVTCLEFFDRNGVHSFLPLKFDDKRFKEYHKKEYEIYKFIATKHLTIKDLTEKQFKKLANTQAIINNLSVKADIPCSYEEIKSPSNRKVSRLEKYSPEGFKLIYDYIYTIDDLIIQNNKLLKYATNILIAGYDNYNLDNIEWVDDYMYLVDYNNCKLINPSVALAESAYYFSCLEGGIDFNRYAKYIQTYLKRSGRLPSDFKEALLFSQNKKLVYLVDIIEKSNKEKKDYSKEMIEIIEDLKQFNSNIDKMYAIYLDIVKK